MTDIIKTDLYGLKTKTTTTSSIPEQTFDNGVSILEYWKPCTYKFIIAESNMIEINRG